jgi:hypothetical protein
MLIRVPKPVVKAYDRFVAWGDQSVRVRRIDLLLGAAFFLGGAWSFWSGGWLILLEYAVLFIFIVLCCLWMG